jgi:hypothetical protein
LHENILFDCKAALEAVTHRTNKLEVWKIEISDWELEICLANEYEINQVKHDQSQLQVLLETGSGRVK